MIAEFHEGVGVVVDESENWLFVFVVWGSIYDPVRPAGISLCSIFIITFVLESWCPQAEIAFFESVGSDDEAAFGILVQLVLTPEGFVISFLYVFENLLFACFVILMFLTMIVPFNSGIEIAKPNDTVPDFWYLVSLNVFRALFDRRWSWRSISGNAWRAWIVRLEDELLVDGMPLLVPATSVLLVRFQMAVDEKHSFVTDSETDADSAFVGNCVAPSYADHVVFYIWNQIDVFLFNQDYDRYSCQRCWVDLNPVISFFSSKIILAFAIGIVKVFLHHIIQLLFTREE